ncbi:MAG TPA: isoprenylcysteine carboxylmethyltransferase family protein [Acidobacteriota bacterium]|nr:isoprenylcysteine carboxylmethyltransferase family protein [Acidobacteriota bacterium]
MDRRAIFRVWVPLLMGAYALGMVYARGPGPHGVLRPVGLALAIIGLSGVILARLTLGKSFSVTAQARALVTTGIYSKIRNPIYVSAEFMLLGVAVMLWNPLVLVFLLAVIPVQVLRARKEARVLEAQFGDEYRAYRAQTWF